MLHVLQGGKNYGITEIASVPTMQVAARTGFFLVARRHSADVRVCVTVLQFPSGTSKEFAKSADTAPKTLN
jgi:hypothetical protein